MGIEKQDNFYAKFCAGFGCRLTKADGLDEWLDWAETVNLDIVFRIINEKSPEFKSGKRPSLGRMKLWYVEKESESFNRSEFNSRPTGEQMTANCKKCQGKGFGWAYFNGSVYNWVCKDCPARVDGQNLRDKIHGPIPRGVQMERGQTRKAIDPDLLNKQKAYFGQIKEGWKHWFQTKEEAEKYKIEVMM